MAPPYLLSASRSRYNFPDNAIKYLAGHEGNAMAGELQGQTDLFTGETVYAIMRADDGTVVKTSNGSLVAYVTANRSQYAISMTPQGTASGYYVGDVPAGVPDGFYGLTAYQRTGGAPAEGDPVVLEQSCFQWPRLVDGLTDREVLMRLLAMATGRIVESPAGTFTYYKQDNVTSLFVLTVTDTERTRS